MTRHRGGSKSTGKASDREQLDPDEIGLTEEEADEIMAALDDLTQDDLDEEEAQADD